MSVEGTLRPTVEQEAILAAVSGGEENLAIRALAGTGKTTTLTMVANSRHLRRRAALALSFNKAIAEELGRRMPSLCHSMSLNACGHRALARGRKVKVKPNKVAGIAREVLGKRGRDSVPEVIDAVNAMKAAGCVPGHARSLCDIEEVHMARAVRGFAAEVSRRSYAAALAGTIDFSDQMLLPVLEHSVALPRYPTLFVDETQDLSPINHAFIERLRAKRVIMAGDPLQAIYGFRGADENSYHNMFNKFCMDEYPLTVTWRCAERIAQEASWHAPELVAAAPGGRVEDLRGNPWRIDWLPTNVTMLCRNNAPLFRLALLMLAAGRRPELRNNYGARFLKTLRGLGHAEAPRAQALAALRAWAQAPARRNLKTTPDMVECLEVFINQAEDLGGACALAEHVLNADGSAKLYTIHRAKGLEWDEVWLIDRHLLRLDEPQDRNALYIAQTRARHALMYANLKDLTR